MTKHLNRRNFLKTSTLGVMGAGIIGNTQLLSQEEKPAPEFQKIKEYRTLGRTGFNASDIGIGTSRLYPTPVIKVLLDAGVNYIDTAERYGRGSAEKSIGEAIKGRDRKSLFITTKLGIRKEDTKEQLIARFRKCLERLDTEYIDCLMIHGASPETVKLDSFHQAVKQLKSEGRLRFTGVSNHGARFRDQPDMMEQSLMAAVQDGRFDVILLVYNFLQKEAGERILAACKEKNIATTIMKSNPVGRYYSMKEEMGRMKKEGKEIDQRMMDYFQRLQKTADKAESFIKTYNLQNPAEIRDAALRFVLNNPKVHVLTLAFSSFEDVENMLKLSGTRLQKKDKQKLAAYKEGCGDLYCRHGCGICETDCPHHVPVNTIMRYNHYFEAHGSEKFAMEKYAQLPFNKAEICRTCTSGSCEISCPHHIPIQALLVMAHQRLTLA